jgi:hypothetical protein
MRSCSRLFAACMRPLWSRSRSRGRSLRVSRAGSHRAHRV